jgi:hypothetical protein
MSRMRWLLLILGMALNLPALADAPELDRTHAAWTALLIRHVHWNPDKTATRVDYDGFRHDRRELDAYLGAVSHIGPAQYQAWPWPEREAFLINAYNAATVQLILTSYPRLTSIKDLGGLFSSPWKRSFVNLLGRTRSLDDIEQSLLRGAPEYRAPRVHFALNCASLGCPALGNEAYVGDAPGMSAAEAAELRAGRIDIDCAPHEWSLNRSRP